MGAAEIKAKAAPSPIRRVPGILQMEAVECGAACLAMILAYHGLDVPLEELRVECAISRDGSKASNILAVARRYGLDARAFRKEPASLKLMEAPLIIHWNFNHFVVLEGFRKGKAYLNDPACGRRVVTEAELDQAFTGVVLAFARSEGFRKGGRRNTLAGSLLPRLQGVRSGLLYIFLAGLALVIPGIVIPAFSRIFVDDILLKHARHWLMPLLLAMGATAILKGVFIWIQQYYLLKLETKLALSGASRFFWHVLHLPVDFFTQRFAGEIGSRVNINDSVATLISAKLVGAGINVVVVVFYLIIMIQYDIPLAGVSLCAGLVNIIVLSLATRKIREGSMRLLQERGRMTGFTMSGLQLIENLKAGGRESDFFSRWAGYQARLMNFEREMGEVSLFLQALPGLSTALNTAIVLVVGGFRVLDGHLTLGMLVAFQYLAYSFLNPINHLVGFGVELQQIRGDLNRLDDVLGYKKEDSSPDPLAIAPGESALDGGVEAPKLEGYLSIRNLTFGYNRQAPPLIENFKLDLAPGSRVALVGGTGSGKSTIVRLIAGLYKPWSGEITFDRIERSKVARDVMENSIAVVDQDISLFEGTLRENLTLWDVSLPEADVLLAARDACIHEDIAARTGGYDHVLEEGGRNFSGGQRQRLEIARALAKKPRILLLDEATSALDPKTEEIIDDNIRRRGCTTLIVAHRLSTIRDCDEIIVLRKGRIMERGTHAELTALGGFYTALLEMSDSGRIRGSEAPPL